jgi:hypothetical protein
MLVYFSWLAIGLLLIILVVLVIVLGLPLLLLRFIRKWLLRNDYQRLATVAMVVAMAFLLFCGYTISTYFFPPDSHYEGAFEEIAGVSFPQSGEIIEGDESGLDPHGDYNTCVRLQVSSEDYARLLCTMDVDTSFRATNFASDTSFVSSQEYQKITQKLNNFVYYRTYSKGIAWMNAYQFVGFLPDHRTIIVYRCSS